MRVSHAHNYTIEIIILMTFCLLLVGCAEAKLKKGGLYVNQSTCVGMDDFGVAKVRNQF
jgi:hypothetical protein